MKRLIQNLVAALALFAAPWAGAQGFPEIAGEFAIATKAAPVAQLRLGTTPQASAKVRLGAVPEARLEALREANQRPTMTRKRLLIGVTREVEAAASPALQWIAVPGGYAARIELTSDDAGSVRLALDLKGVALDVEMVFFGSGAPGQLEGPVRVGDIADRTHAWWSPLTEGASQTVELFAPGLPPAVAPRIEGASHVLTTPSSRFTKRTGDIGASGSCNVDIACSPLATQAQFREISNSVAQMVFNDGGFTGLCTGTLLNDTDSSSQVPYLYSANHCFDETSAPYKTQAQLQQVASTLTTLWFFEAASCRGGQPVSSWVQQGGGSTLLYSNLNADVLFLRLNSAPPAGAFYAGWSANAVSTGTPLVSVHHPRGDLKKVTQGTMLRFGIPGVAGANNSFIEATWSSGTTEPGSSGAGVWSNSNGAFTFRGGLYGGTALCSNPGGTDFFSRFDQVYGSLSQYLAPPAIAAPFTDFTDLWWNPNESGWGLSLIQHPNRMMFAVWYTYGLDGKRTWFYVPSGTWTDSRTYSGRLYTTVGPAADGPFDPTRVRVQQVGAATLTFSDNNNGTLAWSHGSNSGTKAITRQPF
jgi:lysyl endopeptidase